MSELDRTSCWMKFMTRHFLGETSHVELLNTPDLTAPNKRGVGRGGAGGRRKEAEGGAAWPDVGDSGCADARMTTCVAAARARGPELPGTRLCEGGCEPPAHTCKAHVSPSPK